MTHSNDTNNDNLQPRPTPINSPDVSQSLKTKSLPQKIYEWFKAFPSIKDKTPQEINQTLDYFIANKAILSSQDQLKNNALHLAIINSDIETANKLVASGIDTGTKNNQGQTYLDIARDKSESFFQAFTRSFIGLISYHQIANNDNPVSSIKSSGASQAKSLQAKTNSDSKRQ